MNSSFQLGLVMITRCLYVHVESRLCNCLQAFQLGPTEASRYWVYWVPAQYVEAIKDAVLGNWQFF